MRIALAFILGLVVATSTGALAGGFLTGVTAPPIRGYTYNTTTGRGEVELDKFLPKCKGATAVLTVAPDRQTAELKCRAGLLDEWHTAQLPVFQADTQFAVVWSR